MLLMLLLLLLLLLLSFRYVKVYIHKKKDEYGGWPLPYGLNPYR
jgi:hypothetical protein